MKALNYSAISISLVLCVLTGTSQLASAAKVALDIGTFQTISAGHATARKCGELSHSEREELATHAAFAETAAVASNGSGSVMAARKRAKGSAQCGGNARNRAMAGLSAGRKFEQRYVDANRARVRANKRKAKRRQARKLNRRQRARTQASRAQALRTTTRRSVNRRQETRTTTRGSIARFKSQTRAYYLQRRCKHLSYKQALRFWKLVAAQHDRMISRYGSGAVQRAQRQARSSANRSRCSPSTKQQVIAGLRGIRRDVN
ncbi:MAG: hypothetical protein GY948_07455 [Alphaproteobacteria bacterium]|nr:hypothetical protein [Alphaproteobacteria bacterium]